MEPFEKVKSGIPDMDTALDFIRLGDNVVWEVSELSEFKLFVEPYIKQAIEDKRNIIYFRFASHDPVIPDYPEVKKYTIPLSHRFENFTVEIHNIIEKEGRGAFYVFDCLSELQTAWATDMMMGNFFRVTCPFLFILDTVAFFPVIRGKHSVYAIDKIRDTTQLFLEVYSHHNTVYVRPSKVWNRDSDTMFLPHIYNKKTDSFKPILDGVRASRFYQLLSHYRRLGSEQYVDSWDRFFDSAKMLYNNHMDMEDISATMCKIMMTRDEKMRTLVKKHFKPKDYFQVKDHMIGTGMVGGKACGMLLARAIIRNNLPDVANVLEPHDSFFIGSDVYYTYIVDNDFWDLRIRQRRSEEYFKLREEMAERLLNGVFSKVIKEQFVSILEYYGQDPYIVRSSSILEDGFDNAFAGKYESVFCANRGTVEERLNEFEEAVRTVYASSMSLSALDYRKRRGLDKRDEQMSLLVMRVSGSYYGSYYMPCAAGVGYSYSPYQFVEGINPGDGMLRLVMGLGTSAVDRTEGSYPRLVSLSKPEASPCNNSAEKQEFSQKKIEAMDVGNHTLSRMDIENIIPHLPAYLDKALLEHNFDAERRLRERGMNRDIKYVSCEGLVMNQELMNKMKKLLRSLEDEYDNPVDIEYTINLADDGEYLINLLQCRPLQAFKDTGQAKIPDNIPDENIILETTDSSMGLSRNIKVDRIVYVDPVKYYEMPYNDKSRIASFIRKINWAYRDDGYAMVLMVPGRIGTSSPELGVPTAFSDISEFDVICEVEEKGAGYNPELSYGSHFFQDLVEAEILYVAVFANDKTKHWNPDMLNEFSDITDEFTDITDEKYVKDIVKVFDVRGTGTEIYNDLQSGRLVLKK